MPPKTTKTSKTTKSSKSSRGEPSSSVGSKRARQTRGVEVRDADTYAERLEHPPSPKSSNKECIKGTRLVRSYIRESNVYEIFEFQGWLEFMEYKDDLYSVEVVEFYENLQILDGNLTSKVRNVKIDITPALIADLFNIPNEGEGAYFEVPHQWPSHIITRDLCTRALTDGGSYGSVSLSTMPKPADLSPDKHLLALFVTRFILAKNRQDGVLDDNAGVFMYLLLVGRKVNLIYYITHHMFAMKSNTFVPYGMHLTKVFRHFNVPLQSSHVTPFSGKWNLSLKYIRQAKIYLHEGRFISHSDFLALPPTVQTRIKTEMNRQSDLRDPEKTYGPPAADEDEEAEWIAIDTGASTAVPPRAPTFQDMYNVMTEMRDYQMTQFQAIDTRLTSLETDVRQLTSRFDAWHVPFPSEGGHSGGSGGDGSRGEQ